MTDQSRFDGTEQLRMGQSQDGPVECLGRAFETDDTRRDYFLDLLAECLKDPEFRNQKGFPIGDDEDILKMSDPPYYTACPNPFLEDFVRVYGKSYDPNQPYHRDPFAVDVSVGKTDALYKAHSYHTKVPHLAIVPSILHYTEPGDIVLDGFCGSGMTGVAAQFCGVAPREYRMKVESEWADQGLGQPKWGGRHAILGDLSPAAAFIAAGYNVPFDVDELEREARRILGEFDAECGWMYETRGANGTEEGVINYTVWSDVFACPDCGGHVVFFAQAYDHEAKKVRDEFPCPTCGSSLTKRRMTKLTETVSDVDGGSWTRPLRIPVLVNYRDGSGVHEKVADTADLQTIQRVEALGWPTEAPTQALPHMHMTHERARMDRAGITRVHHFYFKRQFVAMADLWSRARRVRDQSVANALLFWVEQVAWSGSLLNSYRPAGFSQTSQYMKGIYYVPAQHAELNPHYVLDGKLDRLLKVFRQWGRRVPTSAVGIADCSNSGLPDCSVDYVFTDPPFGENIYYSDLNFLVESWHGVWTAAGTEAIIDRARKKTIHEYQDLMTSCLREYYRVLKPGRWMTVVFSNSGNAVWKAIQEAIGQAGFVTADVRTLDKQMGSYRQVTSSAVKQDLVISAYRPTQTLLDNIEIQPGNVHTAWNFVSEHLSNLPVAVETTGGIEVVVERTPQMLHDRTVGFFVQRGLAVPLSTAEFMVGLAQRYPERDGMYFIPEHIAEYDKRRAKVDSVRQLSLLVTDESSAIQWVRQQLYDRPQPFSELQPTFMREAQQSWAKYEVQIELKELLEENFLLYDGKGAVPSQIKSYLSTNWREFRNLEADDPSLRAKAMDRWYVPEPGKAADLEKLRERPLLREFAEYRDPKVRKMRLIRTEAVRAGFKRAYDDRDWETIITVAERLPESVVQEDEKLLMYYDVARMRLG